MKIADLIDSLLGGEASLDIPLPRCSSTSQAEQTQRHMNENIPQFDFGLEVRSGRFFLIASRRQGAAKVPYDA